MPSLGSVDGPFGGVSARIGTGQTNSPEYPGRVAKKIENLPTNLDECHELIRRLREENGNLRQAGSFFGQLAERLNRELLAERGPSSALRSPNRAEKQYSGSSR